jgi:hypothetical protein|tara:strand:+ start:1221 stop:1460 length:240 start_codon:yes stop_codon:yes gene_type:complete
MSRWRDFLDGVEIKQDLGSLLEQLSEDIRLIKPRTMNEEVRLSTIDGVLSEIRLKTRKLEHENKVLLDKIAILEEDLDL